MEHKSQLQSVYITVSTAIKNYMTVATTNTNTRVLDKWKRIDKPLLAVPSCLTVLVLDATVQTKRHLLRQFMHTRRPRLQLSPQLDRIKGRV